MKKINNLNNVSKKPSNLQNRRQSKISTDTFSLDVASDGDPEKSGKTSGFRSVFRAAQCLGLFPVSGLRKSESQVEFKPVSLKFFAFLLCLLALIVMEGLGLVNIFLLGKSKKDFKVSQEGYIAPNLSLVSDVAPVVHYGTSVSWRLRDCCYKSSDVAGSCFLISVSFF